MRIPETTITTTIASTCQCSNHSTKPDPMAALDALFKRLQVNTTPQQTKDAVVIHQSSAPIIMSINPTSKSINDFAARMDARFDRIDAIFDRIEATFDRIEVILSSVSAMTKALLVMIKENFGKSEEPLRIYKTPGFAKCVEPKNQARIGDVKTEPHA